MEKCGHVSSGNRKVKKKQGDHKAKKIIQKNRDLYLPWTTIWWGIEKRLWFSPEYRVSP